MYRLLARLGAQGGEGMKPTLHDVLQIKDTKDNSLIYTYEVVDETPKYGWILLKLLEVKRVSRT
jgi:hypothetical protein